MEIRTKFNVGDVVYKIKGFLSLEWAKEHNEELFDELKIKEIRIECRKFVKIAYLFEQFNREFWIEEQDLFATKLKHKRSVREEMGNKILVEFDKRRVKEWCNLQRNYPSSYCPCHDCKQSDKEQIECMLMEGGLYIETDYKIKEQNNGKS